MFKMPKNIRPTERELVEIQRMLEADPTSKFSRDHAPVHGENSETNDVLRVLDAWCIANKQPIMSSCVFNEKTGAASSVFWESVDRYQLRRPGETDTQVLERLRDEAR